MTTECPPTKHFMRHRKKRCWTYKTIRDPFQKKRARKIAKLKACWVSSIRSVMFWGKSLTLLYVIVFNQFILIIIFFNFSKKPLSEKSTKRFWSRFFTFKLKVKNQLQNFFCSFLACSFLCNRYTCHAWQSLWINPIKCRENRSGREKFKNGLT